MLVSVLRVGFSSPVLKRSWCHTKLAFQPVSLVRVRQFPAESGYLRHPESWLPSPVPADFVLPLRLTKSYDARGVLSIAVRGSRTAASVLRCGRKPWTGDRTSAGWWDRGTRRTSKARRWILPMMFRSLKTIIISEQVWISNLFSI